MLSFSRSALWRRTLPIAVKAPCKKISYSWPFMAIIYTVTIHVYVYM